jgi:4-alpha-glucanotransferase
LDFERFVQFEFERQWSNLRRHASRRGVGLIGDIPIFVAHDSADVWAHPELFQLEADGRAKFVSGTPPDMFSRTGQLWGHPQYRWARHRASGFAWWLGRLRRMFALFDAVRLDHFFGFYRVWSVPGRARTAQHGHWIRTPGRELFQAVQRTLGRLEIFAEDLGVETPGALALRDRFGFPGMRLLQFAFGPGPRQYHAPHNYPRQCVVYPGTHDSDTTVGWFGLLKRAARKSRRAGESSDYERVLRYLGTDGREIHWDLIRLAMLSVANVAIIPAQDLLGLDNEARMNIPATAPGNWEWRLRAGAPTAGIARRWRELAVAGDRLRALGNAGQRRRS